MQRPCVREWGAQFSSLFLLQAIFTLSCSHVNYCRCLRALFSSQLNVMLHHCTYQVLRRFDQGQGWSFVLTPSAGCLRSRSRIRETSGDSKIEARHFKNAFLTRSSLAVFNLNFPFHSSSSDVSPSQQCPHLCLCLGLQQTLSSSISYPSYDLSATRSWWVTKSSALGAA